MIAKAHLQETHRTVSPAQTVRRARRLLAPMGITRVANVTGLDSIGIPVVMVCRPNSRSLAVSQGKGLSLDTAKASGIMESIESFHAERVLAPLTLGSVEDLRFARRLAAVDRLPQLAGGGFDAHRPLLWIEGDDLLGGGRMLVPYETVHTNYTLPPATGAGCFVATSSGLASGNHRLEAISHAICEAIERDATTIWEASPDADPCHGRIALDTIDDPDCREALRRFEAAGVAVGVWDITTDAGVPVLLSMIANRDTLLHGGLYSARGMGCHPVREIALLRALTEAAQSRLTLIAGARDDMVRSDYEAALDNNAIERQRRVLVDGDAEADFRAVPSAWHDSFDDDVAWLLERLAVIGIEQVVCIDLERPEFEIAVVRIVIPGLEGPMHKVPDYVLGRRATLAQAP